MAKSTNNLRSVVGLKADEQRPVVLKRLRAKFIAINMVLALLVLGSTFSFVSYFDYSTRLDTIYSELSYVLTEASTPRAEQLTGTQPLRQTDNGSGVGSANSANAGSANAANSDADRSRGTSAGERSVAATTSQRSTTTTGTDSEGSSPMIGTQTAHNNSVILLAVYDVTPSGSYTVVSNYTNATIPEQTILRANDLVRENASTKGWLERYDLYFMQVASPDDPENFLVAYADGSSVNSWRTLTLTLLIGGLVALLVFFIINIYFSKWALRPVELSIKQQQQFTADASHELKTPLTVIIANMAILKSQPDDTIADQMQWIESTHTEAERMQLLVNDMLTLSRAETQKQQIAEETVDFSDLVEGEVLQFESVAFERGVDIDSEIEEGLLVKGDPERLGRMVATLVDNACKYAGTESDGAQANDELLGADSADEEAGDAGDGSSSNIPTVTVTLNRKSVASVHTQSLELKVHNTGAPIPKEDLPHIFTRFYRADKARTSSKGSYGLGLAIGQEIAIEHKGDISVTSSAGNGTTFTVTLPLLPGDHKMVEEPAESVATDGGQASSQASDHADND